jgi:hypothetical protein
MGYLDVRATAAHFGLNPRTIYKEIEEGRLPAIRIHEPGLKRPTVRIPIAALEAWESTQLVNGQKQASHDNLAALEVNQKPFTVSLPRFPAPAKPCTCLDRSACKVFLNPIRVECSRCGGRWTVTQWAAQLDNDFEARDGA